MWGLIAQPLTICGPFPSRAWRDRRRFFLWWWPLRRLWLQLRWWLQGRFLLQRHSDAYRQQLGAKFDMPVCVLSINLMLILQLNNKPASVCLWYDGSLFLINKTQGYQQEYKLRRARNPPTYHRINSCNVHWRHHKKCTNRQQSTADNLFLGR